MEELLQIIEEEGETRYFIAKSQPAFYYDLPNPNIAEGVAIGELKDKILMNSGRVIDSRNVFNKIEPIRVSFQGSQTTGLMRQGLWVGTSLDTYLVQEGEAYLTIPHKH